MKSKKKIYTAITVAVSLPLLSSPFIPFSSETVLANTLETAKPPNIVVIFGDDIGISNISAYTFGLMGYRTPNIDRLAKEGMMFTDYYAEQSSTAGRSATMGIYWLYALIITKPFSWNSVWKGPWAFGPNPL